MKNLTFIILASLSIVSFKMAALTGYPFTVNTKGDGSQAILFIPGFASSGNVWEATMNALPANYKSYSFTMAGFAGVQLRPIPPLSIGRLKLYNTYVI